MKNYSFGLLFLILGGLLTDINAQTLQKSTIHSTIKLNENITITDATKSILDNTTIETSKNIDITSASVEMNNATIKCDKITFSAAVKNWKISQSVKIICREIIFDNSGGPSDLLINNSEPGELSVSGIRTIPRKLVFTNLDNFKVNFENE